MGGWEEFEGFPAERNETANGAHGSVPVVGEISMPGSLVLRDGETPSSWWDGRAKCDG
jgi:hypothetical protein